MSDRPAFAWEHDLLAAIAAQLLDDRRRGYPALLAAGKLSEAAAADGIRIMAAIEADWRRIAALYRGDRSLARDDGASIAEKRDTLAAAVTRLEANLARQRKALPRMLPTPDGCPADLLDCGDLALEDLIRIANEGQIMPDPIRAAARTLERLHAAEAMLWHYRKWPTGQICAEISADWVAVRQARLAA